MLSTKIRGQELQMGTTASPEAESEDLFDGGEVHFPAGLPGLPSLHRFSMERLHGELQPFVLMRSVDQPEICFVLVAPGLLFPDYSVEIDEQHVASLELEGAEDAAVMLIITLGERPTANLLGPLVINRGRRCAAQVVQHQTSYRVAEPLPVGSTAGA